MRTIIYDFVAESVSIDTVIIGREMKKLFVVLIFFVTIVTDCYAKDSNSELHSGFIYLSDLDPSILINLKYHTDDNFVGKHIQGCTKRKAVVTVEAAEALRNVQEDLVMHGYSLVVYNAYHPKKTYQQFESWLHEEDSELIKSEHYPNHSKAELIKVGYIQAKSAHARGSTVDVTIISLKDKLKHPCKKRKRSYKNQKDLVYMDDGSVDMGTSYDLFDSLSAYDNKSIPSEARDNRTLLRESMENHGFIQHKKFWWQFTLVREPYADSKFDFDV